MKNIESTEESTSTESPNRQRTRSSTSSPSTIRRQESYIQVSTSTPLSLVLEGIHTEKVFRLQDIKTVSVLKVPDQDTLKFSLKKHPGQRTVYHALVSPTCNTVALFTQELKSTNRYIEVYTLWRSSLFNLQYTERHSVQPPHMKEVLLDEYLAFVPTENDSQLLVYDTIKGTILEKLHTGRRITSIGTSIHGSTLAMGLENPDEIRLNQMSIAGNYEQAKLRGSIHLQGSVGCIAIAPNSIYLSVSVSPPKGAHTSKQGIHTYTIDGSNPQLISVLHCDPTGVTFAL